MAATKNDEVENYKLLLEYSTLKHLLDAHKSRSSAANFRKNPYSLVKHPSSNKSNTFRSHNSWHAPGPLPKPNFYTPKLFENTTNTKLHSRFVKKNTLTKLTNSPPKLNSTKPSENPIWTSPKVCSNVTDAQKKPLCKYKFVRTAAENPSSKIATPVNTNSKLISPSQRKEKHSWTKEGISVSTAPSTSKTSLFIKSKYTFKKLKNSPKSLTKIKLSKSPRSQKFGTTITHHSASNFSKSKHKWNRSSIRIKSPKGRENSKERCNPKTTPKRNKFMLNKMVTLNGEKFSVSGSRRVLRKSIQTPRKTLEVGKVSPVSHRQVRASRAINLSIYRLNVAKSKSKQFCLFYNKFGKCNKKGEGKCPYIHDPQKVAICKRFLRGKCEVESCPFAHTRCPSKMPTCSFFIHGSCNNGDKCDFSHVNVNKDAQVCSDFVNGYCPAGEGCKKWHINRCFKFEEKGVCDKEKCTLLHRKKDWKAKVFKTAETEKPCSITSQLKLSDNIRWEGAHQSLPAFIPINCNS